ncbi:MAG: hypothetical protein GY765_05795 [bacterium]|nr:hypothetical protein [bacterium]
MRIRDWHTISKVLLFSWLCVLILSGAPLMGDEQYGSNSSIVYIPDVGSWVGSSITISNAPANAVVTGMDISFSCTHTYSGDLQVQVNDGEQAQILVLWDNEGGSAPNPTRTLYNDSTFNGLAVNGTWQLSVQDSAGGDTGYIDQWWIRIYYDSAQTYAVFADIDSFIGITDADGDGYYEKYEFRINIDADAYPDATTVWGRMICNTTGQSWWTTSSWEVSGSIPDYHFFEFDEENFEGRIFGNTTLDFTVQIWDSTGTTLLATAPNVPGDTIKVDRIVPFAVYGITNSFVGGTDADGDGYYETFDFQIGIDGDAGPELESVCGRMICTTTGQSWWSSTNWEISGTATDYQYFAFDETNFAGHITDNTTLEFTVELWNEDKTTLLATDTPVYGDTVNADSRRIQYIFHGADYNGDGAADIAVYRPSTGRWCFSGATSIPYGIATDIPVPGDYDGDGAMDIAVYRPSTGRWCIRVAPSTSWGTATDIPVPGDYNGDGITDIAIYRPSNGRWCIKGQPSIAWGTSTDIPVPADYDGDGTTDIAIFRPSNGRWCIMGQPSIAWGTSTDIPVPADYDGDGTTDIAIFRPSTGRWCIMGQPSISWGTSTDIAVPADYDGDGDADIAIFRPSNGAWAVMSSPSKLYGISTDIPLVSHQGN